MQGINIRAFILSANLPAGTTIIAAAIILDMLTFCIKISASVLSEISEVINSMRNVENKKCSVLVLIVPKRHMGKTISV
jgi:hypothetical protein